MALSAIGAIAALAGAGATLYSATNQPDMPSYQGGGGYQYIPQNSAAADTRWSDALNNEWNILQKGNLSSLTPYLQQILRQQQALPYAGYQQAGQAAAGQYGALSAQDQQTARILQGLAAQGIGQGQQLYGQGQQMYGQGQQILNTAMDPQSELYKRTLQQVQDQTRAAQSVRGISMSPFGAGLEDQSIRDFNIDWQNQQLARQVQGMQAASQGFGAAQQGYGGTLAANQLAGSDYAAALQMLGQGAQASLLQGQTPVSVGQNIGQMQSGAVDQYTAGLTSLMSPYGGVQGQITPYLYAGQNAGYNAFNQAFSQQAFNASQQKQASQGFIQALNQFAGSKPGQAVDTWLGNVFGGSGGGGSEANYYGSGSVNTVPHGGY